MDSGEASFESRAILTTVSVVEPARCRVDRNWRRPFTNGQRGERPRSRSDLGDIGLAVVLGLGTPGGFARGNR